MFGEITVLLYIFYKNSFWDYLIYDKFNINYNKKERLNFPQNKKARKEEEDF